MLVSGRGSLVPSLTAFVVCDLLSSYCPLYTDCDFTATMESTLDSIARGEADKLEYLKGYYEGPQGLQSIVEKMDRECTADTARRARLPQLYSPDGEDTVSLFVGPWGPYVAGIDANGTRTTAPLPSGMVQDLSMLSFSALTSVLEGRRSNGTIMGTFEGKDVRLLVGRFGAYLQVGEKGEEGARTQTLPKRYGGQGGGGLVAVSGDGADTDVPLNERVGLTFEDAIGYLSLPRQVVEHEGLPIEANIGRYGPYLKYNSSFVSLPPPHDVLTIGPEAGMAIVVEGIVNKKGKTARGVLKDLGDVEGGKLTVRDGRFGVYLNWKKTNAKMPKEHVDEPAEITKEEAWAAIQAKSATGKALAKDKKAKRGKKQKAEEGSVTLPPPPKVRTSDRNVHTAQILGISSLTPCSPRYTFVAKRPPSAYLLFCAENRPEVSKTSKKLGDVSKELARLWKDVEGSREKWEGMAAEAKRAHEIEKGVWEEECRKLRERAKMSGASAKPKKEEKGKEKPDKAPRAPSAYMIFCSENRRRVMEMTNDDGERLSFGEVTKTLAAQWKALGEEEKEVYHRKKREKKDEKTNN